MQTYYFLLLNPATKLWDIWEGNGEQSFLIADCLAYEEAIIGLELLTD